MNTVGQRERGGGFLRRLEHREDLERLCIGLAADAMQARELAARREHLGDLPGAARCREVSRATARRALRLLWMCRRTTEPGGASSNSYRGT
jgi:hypothetical protein